MVLPVWCNHSKKKELLANMLIEVTTGNNESKKSYMRKLIQSFIEIKMEAYCELERGVEESDNERDSLRIKYLASLWMISSVVGIMTMDDIAEQSGIASSILKSWEEDKTFKSLVECNYQEFLIYIVNLFA
jgi:hypothetical protein